MDFQTQEFNISQQSDNVDNADNSDNAVVNKKNNVRIDQENNNGQSQSPKNISEDEKINIKVCNASGGETYFRVKKTTKMSRLMKKYCKKDGLLYSTIRFTFDGSRIGEDETPGSLEMEDGDIIDVLIEQSGGASYIGLDIEM